MLGANHSQVLPTVLVLIAGCLFALPAHAQYSGGTGEPNDPYQIATAAELIALGNEPNDYDKHFILTADINLDPNLPRRKVFDKAVIAPDTNAEEDYLYQETPFSGVFDGMGHTISHLTIQGGTNVGLFGHLSSAAQITNLGVVDVSIVGSGDYVGSLVGDNRGSLDRCYGTGVVGGSTCVGGLVGQNEATMTGCYSAGAVSGTWANVGGLVGSNWSGTVTQCYSTDTVSGGDSVGGLVGSNGGTVTQCYCTGMVSGTGKSWRVGGLVGDNSGAVTQCYSAGAVSGTGQDVGGLVGSGSSSQGVTTSFWDTQNVRPSQECAGRGKTTAEMQTAKPFLEAGWDFVGETQNGTHEVWQMPQGSGYPILSVFHGYTAPQLQGAGTAKNPYLIHDALELGAIVHYSPNAHYRLAVSIDLSGICWSVPVIPSFGGTFDGNGHTITHLTIGGAGCLGLFGQVGSGAKSQTWGW